jgi:probable F420-dependent oxidoreductase
MTAVRPFRFGVVTAGAASRAEWVALARRAEALGYAILVAPDHFRNALATGPALLTAAEVTTTLRIGSLVFDNDFRHPTMLAKEAASLDVLSGGRFELGLGAGWMRSEYDTAGLAFDPPGLRVGRLEEAVRIVKGLFADPPLHFAGRFYRINGLDGLPKPVQRPHPPLVIGGGGRRLLSLAAREADIVGFAPRAKADGSGLDRSDITAAAVDDKVAWVREAAGDRFASLELNLLVQAVAVTDDRAAAIEPLMRRFETTAEVVESSPFVFVGSVDRISETLRERRERYGISYWVVFEASMEAFAPVVARLHGV